VAVGARALLASHRPRKKRERSAHKSTLNERSFVRSFVQRWQENGSLRLRLIQIEPKSFFYLLKS